jgi:predicted metal-dependent HD superfamily phosphohydrolase
MNTRDVMLVGAGVVVGYLLVGFLNKSKDNAQASTGSTGSTVDQTKLADCTKKVEEQLASTQFKVSKDFDINAYKKELIDKCLKGGAV